MNDNVGGILAAIFGLVVITIGVLAALWNKVLNWSQNSLMPWLERKMSFIADKVKEAFIWLDKNVIIPIRNAVKRAWEILRNFLLKMLTTFEQKTLNEWTEWVRKTTFWMIEKLTPETSIKKVVETEVVNWGDLPPDIRETVIRQRQQREYEIDVTKLRDKEISEMDMKN